MRSSCFTITAHTGCDGTAENTVQSALKGIRLGADCVEVDVRADPDGRLFLWHHDVAELASGGSIPIQPLKLEELRSLERRGGLRVDRPGARVTTLEELAAALGPLQGQINLDLKDDRSAELVGPAVHAAGLGRRVVITGCDASRLSIVRQASPDLSVYLNSDFDGAPPGSLGRARIQEECRIAREAECCGLNLHHRCCSPTLVEVARAEGLLVSVWTVAPRDGFQRFIEMGVDNITTRHVAELVAIAGSAPPGLRHP